MREDRLIFGSIVVTVHATTHCALLALTIVLKNVQLAFEALAAFSFACLLAAVYLSVAAKQRCRLARATFAFVGQKEAGLARKRIAILLRALIFAASHSTLRAFGAKGVRLRDQGDH